MPFFPDCPDFHFPFRSRQREEERRKRADQKQREKEERDKEDRERKIERDKKKEEERVESEKRREVEKIESDKRREAEKIENDKRREAERKRREEEARLLAERIAADKAAFQQEFGALYDDNVSTSRVTFWEKKKDGKYYFTIEVYRPTGNRVIYRTYQDFYDFHVRLLECFPDDSGTGGSRIIPYLPGQKLFVNDAVCKERREELDAYSQNLYRLPPRIIRCRLVAEFFKTSGMDELYLKQAGGSAPPSTFTPTPIGGGSGGGGSGSARLPPRSSPSAPSSSGGNTAPAPGRFATSAPSQAAPVTSSSEEFIPPPPSRRPPPPGAGVGQMERRPSIGPPRPSSNTPRPAKPPAPAGAAAGRPPPPKGPPPGSSAPSSGFAPGQKLGGGGPGRAPSSEALVSPQPRAAAPAAANGGGAEGPMIKVKVYNKEDIVAFVVPKSVKFAQLKEKAFKKVLKAAPRPLPPLSCPPFLSFTWYP